jgi:hypothetical protein
MGLDGPILREQDEPSIRRASFHCFAVLAGAMLELFELQSVAVITPGTHEMPDREIAVKTRATHQTMKHLGK